MAKSDNSSPNSSSDHQQSSEPKYTGVRKRKWGKWVSEIRLPNSRERIWLGSYDTREKAARAFDAALYCLRGPGAKFNFPDSPPDIDGCESLSPEEIQAIAAKFANEASSSTTTNLDANAGTNIPESSFNQNDLTSDNGAKEMPSTGMDWSFLNLMDFDCGVSDYGYYQEFNYVGNEFYPPPPSVIDDGSAGNDDHDHDDEGTYYLPPFLWDF